MVRAVVGRALPPNRDIDQPGDVDWRQGFLSNYNGSARGPVRG
jgi:hypothetical protein